MSPQRSTRWPAGAPTWIDVTTPDMDSAKAFYGGLLGWTFGEGSEEFGGYCMCEVDGVAAAGMAPAMEGMPPAWTLYFGTDDVAASAAAIPALGGSLLSEVMQIADSGSMVVAADPSGAAFGLWQADEMTGIQVFSEPGGLAWEDLRSKDPAAAKVFYAAVNGWEYHDLEMAGPEYATFHHAGDEAPLGGLGGMMGMDSSRRTGSSLPRRRGRRRRGGEGRGDRWSHPEPGLRHPLRPHGRGHRPVGCQLLGHAAQPRPGHARPLLLTGLVRPRVRHRQETSR